MAIHGGTPQECFERFLDHVQWLVSQMLTRRYPLLCPRNPRAPDLRILSFANGAIPLKTPEHGTIYLYLAQELTAKREDADFVLRTRRYWYKIYDRSPTQNDDPDAIVRWEYVSAPKLHDTKCRHHVQFGKMVKPLALGNSHFDFTHFHIPSGWVTIEEVCRFLVTEFRLVPPCGSAWPQILADSEGAFYNGFTNKGASGFSR